MTHLLAPQYHRSREADTWYCTDQEAGLRYQISPRGLDYHLYATWQAQQDVLSSRLRGNRHLTAIDPGSLHWHAGDPCSPAEFAQAYDRLLQQLGPFESRKFQEFINYRGDRTGLDFVLNTYTELPDEERARIQHEYEHNAPIIPPPPKTLAQCAGKEASWLGERVFENLWSRAHTWRDNHNWRDPKLAVMDKESVKLLAHYLLNDLKNYESPQPNPDDPRKLLIRGSLGELEIVVDERTLDQRLDIFG